MKGGTPYKRRLFAPLESRAGAWGKCAKRRLFLGDHPSLSPHPTEPAYSWLEAIIGDYYQQLAFPDVTNDHVGAVRRLRAWMISKRIIVSETSDCIVGAGSGHRRGERAHGWLGCTRADFRNAEKEGVAFHAGRRVYHADALDAVTCPSCAAEIDWARVKDGWNVAVTSWFKGEDNETLTCPSCNTSSRVASWRHHPTWGFAEVGVTFWNWPPLSRFFTDAFEDVVGSNSVYVIGESESG